MFLLWWWCVILYFFQVYFDYGGVYCEVGVYVLFCNGIWVCADICYVSSVMECGLILESVSVCVVGMMDVVLFCDACLEVVVFFVVCMLLHFLINAAFCVVLDF